MQVEGGMANCGRQACGKISYLAGLLSRMCKGRVHMEPPLRSVP